MDGERVRGWERRGGGVCMGGGMERSSALVYCFPFLGSIYLVWYVNPLLKFYNHTLRVRVMVRIMKEGQGGRTRVGLV